MNALFHKEFLLFLYIAVKKKGGDREASKPLFLLFLLVTLSPPPSSPLLHATHLARNLFVQVRLDEHVRAAVQRFRSQAGRGARDAMRD